MSYTQDTLQQELQTALAPLQQDNPRIPETKRAFNAIGRALLQAKEHLSQEEIWAALDHVNLSRVDAWQIMTDFQESAAIRATYKPYADHAQELKQRLHEVSQQCEDGEIPDDLAMMRITHLTREFGELCSAWDKLPVPASRPQDYKVSMFDVFKESLKQAFTSEKNEGEDEESA